MGAEVWEGLEGDECEINLNFQTGGSLNGHDLSIELSLLLNALPSLSGNCVASLTSALNLFSCFSGAGG